MPDPNDGGPAPPAAPLRVPMDTRGWLAIGGFAQVSVVLLLLAFFPIPSANRDLFMVMAGQVIGGGFLLVANYYFGASKGATEANARADAALAKLPGGAS